MAQARQAELAGAVHDRVIRKRRIEPPAWPASVPIVSTPTPRMSRSCASRRDVAASKPGLCGPSACDVEERAGARPPAPAGAQQHPGARRHAAVRRFPAFERRRPSAGNRDRGRPRHVTSITQAGPTNRRAGNRVARVVGQVLAGDPVDGRVEVRAGVLAERERVPVPARSALVVAGELRRSSRRATPRRSAAGRSPACPVRAAASDRRPAPCRPPAPARGD